MFSIDSIVATRRESFFITYRGLKPTAKVIRPLRGQRRVGIARNKYANDPGKLAAWLSAKHVEKVPKKKETPTP